MADALAVAPCTSASCIAAANTASQRRSAADECSGRGSIVVVQHPAQPLAAPHCPAMIGGDFFWHDQSIAESVVVALVMIRLVIASVRPPPGAARPTTARARCRAAGDGRASLRASL
jgi:hypothetical protein